MFLDLELCVYIGVQFQGLLQQIVYFNLRKVVLNLPQSFFQYAKLISLSYSTCSAIYRLKKKGFIFFICPLFLFVGCIFRNVRHAVLPEVQICRISGSHSPVRAILHGISRGKSHDVVGSCFTNMCYPPLATLTSQVEGPRFELRRDLTRSETGSLLSIGVSVANVIRAPC